MNALNNMYRVSRVVMTAKHENHEAPIRKRGILSFPGEPLCGEYGVHDSLQSITIGFNPRYRRLD